MLFGVRALLPSQRTPGLFLSFLDIQMVPATCLKDTFALSCFCGDRSETEAYSLAPDR